MPARKASARPSRAEQARREKEARSLRRRLVVAAILAIALAVVVLVTRTDEDAAAIDAVEASGACEYDTVTDEDPPASGDVADTEPAEPDFYEPDDESPGDRALLRSMRQGFVVLWYSPESIPPDGLHGISDRFGRDLIVVPRPGLPVPVAVTAWGRRALCASYDEEALAAFTEAFRDEGPEQGFL